MNQLQHVKDLPAKLRAKKGFSLNMTIGLDGFVDEIIHVVDKRQDAQNFTRLKTIGDFGKRISSAAGLSTNIEMVTTQFKLGGNGPILSNALIEYGVNLTYVGALGKPEIHPVFKDMVARADKVYSLIEPGRSDCVEFEDGKIIIGKHSTLASLTWDVFKDALGGASGIAQLINNTHLFGMENWTMLPYMSDIWRGIITEVFPLVRARGRKPLAFFDLADPEKRTFEDIRDAMKLIRQFEEQFRVVLGLNAKEAYEIAHVLGVTPADNSLEVVTCAVYRKLGIYCLVVHPVHNAACVVDGDYFETDGPYCKKPKLTTGAGDNFNAGFCLGLALGLDPLDCLTLGVSTSGVYVRNAKSPSYDEVINFAEAWASGAV